MTDVWRDADPWPSGPFTHADALASGVTRHALRTAVASRRLRRVARGVYHRAEPVRSDAERWELVRQDHRRRLEEALLRFPGAVASHASAALLHGLELVLAPGAEVELTVRERLPRSRRHTGIVVHHCDSTEVPWVPVDGLRATPVDRTCADVLRSRRPPHAVAMLDRALDAGLTSLDDVRQELSTQRRWVGRPRALAALELSDARRESWLESFSFVQLHELGLGMPLAQVDVLDEHYRFVARVDGLLPGTGAFLEADGEGKYFLDADGGAVSDAVAGRLSAESIRHDRLERLGLAGARWTAHEIMTEPGAVLTRIMRAVSRAEEERFHGWLRWDGRVGRVEDFAKLGQPPLHAA
jgi:hypothetical protein